MAQHEDIDGRDEPGYDVSAERRALFGLCYRLLGSHADAEDAVQDTYIRWYRMGDTERQGISSARAWLMKVASRICLDLLGSARVRREKYVGEWLPEPAPTSSLWSTASAVSALDPAERTIADESVSMAMLVVMESLTPAERVAFVLHDVFDYGFGDIGEVLTRSPGACRQLATSARRHVRQRTRHLPIDSAQHAAAVLAFQRAWQIGDISALVKVLAPDAVAITDGGGAVSAALEPVRGAEAVAHFFAGIHVRQEDLEVKETLVNGEPGLVGIGGGQVLAVVAFALSEAGIAQIWAVRNPAKLGAWSTR
ncbi:RNA polymerase sigma factor SigJ [Actinomycetaceae bacterium L2_0104]